MEQARRKDVVARQAARREGSFASKLSVANRNWLLHPRRCLAALIKINLCKEDTCHSTTLFCADDIFVARCNMLDATNTSAWLTDECSRAGEGPMTFDGIEMTDETYCALYDIKVPIYLRSHSQSLHIFELEFQRCTLGSVFHRVGT